MNLCVCLCALCVCVCMRMCACQNLTSNGRWMTRGLFFFVAGDFDYFDSDRCAIESAESPLAHCSSKPSTSLESQSQNSMSVCPDTHRWGRPYRFNHFAALDKPAMLRSSNVNIFGEEAKNVERRTRKKKCVEVSVQRCCWEATGNNGKHRLLMSLPCPALPCDPRSPACINAVSNWVVPQCEWAHSKKIRTFYTHLTHFDKGTESKLSKTGLYEYRYNPAHLLLYPAVMICNGNSVPVYLQYHVFQFFNIFSSYQNNLGWLVCTKSVKHW
jgi:hypothetical protein